MVTLILGVAIGWKLLKSDDNQNRDSEESAISEDSKVSAGSVAVKYYDPISSEDELANFVKAIDRNQITEVHEIESVNWSTQKVVPFDFFISAGKSLKEASFKATDNVAYLQIFKAPSGCMFPAVQYQHMAFISVDKNVTIDKQEAKISLIENLESCPEL